MRVDTRAFRGATREQTQITSRVQRVPRREIAGSSGPKPNEKLARGYRPRRMVSSLKSFTSEAVCLPMQCRPRPTSMLLLRTCWRSDQTAMRREDQKPQVATTGSLGQGHAQANGYWAHLSCRDA